MREYVHNWIGVFSLFVGQIDTHNNFHIKIKKAICLWIRIQMIVAFILNEHWRGRRSKMKRVNILWKCSICIIVVCIAEDWW